MNPFYYRIALDIHDATSQLSFSIKKGDTNRRLLISLMDNGTPYTISGDCYAVFSARKPNGKVVFNDCTIKNNLIVYDITEDNTTIEGRLDCEITLYGEYGQQITSPRFTIIVYASVLTESEVESSDEYKALNTLVREGNDLVKDMERALENGDLKIVSTELIGQDENGGNIYQQTFGNGDTAEFTAPRGEALSQNIEDGIGDGAIVTKLNEEHMSGGTTVLTNSCEGDGSTGFGIGVNVKGKCSHGKGYKITIEGDYNTGEGNEIYIYGRCCRVKGSNINIGTQDAVSAGYHIVDGQNIILNGIGCEGNKIKGNVITVGGNNCKYNSLSGNNIILSGSIQKSIIFGNDIDVVLYGTGMTINGRGIIYKDSKNRHDGFTILGQYPIAITDSHPSRDSYANVSLIVGCGTSDTDRKNSLEIFKDGTVRVYDETTGGMVELGSGGTGGGLSEEDINALISQATTNKLDKFTTKTNYEQVYTVSADGTQQYTIGVSASASNGTIPKRDSKGQIRVPSVPTEVSHATSKQYVDTNFSRKLYEHLVTIMDITGVEGAEMIPPFTITILTTDNSIGLTSGYSTSVKNVSDRLVKYCTKAPNGNYIKPLITFLTHPYQGQRFGFWTDYGDGDEKYDVTLEIGDNQFHILSTNDNPMCTVLISTREI